VVVLIILLVVIGTIGFRFLEGWSPLESLYATIITITTVGYGDFTPQTSAGRVFTIFFGVVAVGVAGYAISNLAAWMIQRQQNRAAYKLRERKMNQLEELKDHIIVCGSGTISAQAAREFFKSNIPLILIDTDETALRLTMLLMEEEFWQHRAEQYRRLGFLSDDASDVEQLSLAQLSSDLGVLYLLEDPTEDHTLYKAGIERARGLVTVMNNDRDNLFVVLTARQLASRVDNSELYIVARLNEGKNRSKLSAAGANRIISLDLTIGYQIATSMLYPEIAHFWLNTMQGDRPLRFSVIHVGDQPELVGQSVAQVKEQQDQLVVAIKRKGEYLYTPALDTPLVPEDILITIASSKSKVRADAC
jgi:voltage-gated potassium channel